MPLGRGLSAPKSALVQTVAYLAPAAAVLGARRGLG